MQQPLFHEHLDWIDAVDSYDPYEEVREPARRLAGEYVIDEDEAFRAILAFGSESGARRILRQRRWMGEVGRRETEAA